MSSMSTRRQFLVRSGALIASTALPLPAIAAVAETAQTVEIPKLLAFAAGSSGEFDWKPFFAATEGEAMQMAREYFGYTDDEYFGFEFQRVKRWDDRGSEEAVTAADWIRADLGHNCSRCHNETFGGDDGYAIGDEAVCEECLSVAERLTIKHPYDAVDELAERIADEGEAETHQWLLQEGAWAAAQPHWAKAIEAANA